MDVYAVLDQVETLDRLLLAADQDDVDVGLAPDCVMREAAEQDRRDDIAILTYFADERVERGAEQRDSLGELLVARGAQLLESLAYHIVQHPFSQLAPGRERPLLDRGDRHLEESGDLVLGVVTDVVEQRDHAFVLG